MTPPVATEALLRRVELPHRLWECACGDGTGILDPLRAAGHEVIGSDLVDYGRPDCFWRRDFLDRTEGARRLRGESSPTRHTNWPSNSSSTRSNCRRCVMMLLRLAFSNPRNAARSSKIAGSARILCFRKRLPMMHRRGWEGKKGNSGMAFAWFIWDRSHAGPTTIERISWER